jgi:hypothetical protein
LLDSTLGGPSVPVEERDQSTRRTLYLAQKRGDLPFVQQLFDAPSALACSGQRRNSTVALQPLFLLNDPSTLRYAQAFADRVVKGSSQEFDRRASYAFELALSRQPDDEEKILLQQFMANAEPNERLVKLCHALLNLNEFHYIP